MKLATPALDAWRRRGDVARRDDLWRAATWEAAALAVLRSRPNAQTAPEPPGPSSLPAPQRPRWAAPDPELDALDYVSIPYPLATADTVLDHRARLRADFYLERADEIVDSDGAAIVELADTPPRATGGRQASGPIPDGWARARRGAWV